MNDLIDVTGEKRWYVAHTYSGYENKVKTNLEKIIENRGLHDKIVDIRIPVETHVEVSVGRQGSCRRRENFPELCACKDGHD